MGHGALGMGHGAWEELEKCSMAHLSLVVNDHRLAPTVLVGAALIHAPCPMPLS
ncbi:MAG: hypothetical protein KME19_01010 [Microcoleus vaginatus WJT46-NPBG5]|nr:hypothetical protein [Microcoleus vaginatus WJT46-NPBG5]